MNSVEILCALGRQQTGTLKIEDCVTLMESIQSLASIGNESGFSPLPPILLNDSEQPSRQQLFGTESSGGNVYTAGPAPWLGHGALIGGAVLELAGVAKPVLIFADHVAKRITCIATEAPLSQLESEFFKFRAEPSEIEIKWKGFELASSHIVLFEMMQEHFKGACISTVPNYMLKKEADSYYLSRSGPIPFLHLRLFRNEEERSSLEGLIRRYLQIHTAGDGIGDGVGAPIVNNDAGDNYEFKTIFTKCNLVETLESLTSCSDQICQAASKLSEPSALHMAMACLLNTTLNMESVPKNGVLDTKEHAHGKNGDGDRSSSYATISDLMKCSSRLSSTVAIACPGGMHAQIRTLTASIFEPEDAKIVAKDVLLSPEATLSKITNSGRFMLRELSKRLDTKSFIMSIDMNSNREIKSIRLSNSKDEYELDVDCAGRLFDCNGIIPIAIVQRDRQSVQFFRLESSGVGRRLARACLQLKPTLYHEPLQPGETNNGLHELKDAKERWEQTRAGEPLPVESAKKKPKPL